MQDRKVGAPVSDIIARIRASDKQMFEAVFMAYYSELCDFANNYVRSPAVAEDVVSEVFARLWESRAGWNPPTTVQAYLFGIVHRRAIDAYRSSAAEDHRYSTTLSGNESWGMSPAPLPPDINTEHSDNAERLWREVARLPATQRLVLSLRWRQGMSWDEIASVMNSSSSAAQMHHSRAMKTLRERLC